MPAHAGTIATTIVTSAAPTATFARVIRVVQPGGERWILARGGAHLFPSRALLRVAPVTKGTRWALVAWTG